jgi:archaetidylinositol phosphate synthase
MLKNSEFGQGLSKFLGRIFRNFPLHPNLITASSAVFALMGYVVYAQRYDYAGWVAFGLFLLALFVDAVDGAVARAKNLQTRKGAFIDGVFDRVVEFFIILTLIAMPVPIVILQKDVWLMGVLFFGTGMTSFVKAYAEHTEVMHHARAVKMPGMLERAERSALLMLVMLLVILGSEYSAAVLMFTALLSFLTFVERFAYVMGSKE